MTSNKVIFMTNLMAMHANGDSNMDANNEYIRFYGHGYVLLMTGIPNF